MTRTFKYVVLQRINFPSVYNNRAYTPQNNFLKLNELEVLNHSGENLLRAGHGAAIGTIDFELSQDNVGSWTDMDLDGQLGLATAQRGPKALIDSIHDNDHSIHMNDQNQAVKLSWALELSNAIPIDQIAQAKIYQADENNSTHPNYGDLKYRGTGLKLLFFDADRNLIIECPETKIPQMVYTFTLADVILHEPPTVNYVPPFETVPLDNLQFEYLANAGAAGNNWPATFTRNLAQEIVTPPPIGAIPSGWSTGSDADGAYVKINGNRGMVVNFPAKTLLKYIDDVNTDPKYFVMEMWIKAPTYSHNKRGWLMGAETGWGPYLAINDSRLGGIGLTPGASSNQTYRSEHNPGYISSKLGQLLHIYAYMYADDSGNYFKRGLYINGVHHPQMNTQEAPFNNGGIEFPMLDDTRVNSANFVVGNILPDTNDVHSAKEIQIYSMRAWLGPTALTEGQIKSLHTFGPHASVLSQPTPPPPALPPANNESESARGDFPVLQQTDGSPLNYNQYMDQNNEEFRCYEFTNVGETSIVLDRDIVGAKITILGGGGGGGFWAGGGGGGGGLLVLEDQTLYAGTYNIEVGAGGPGWKQGGGVVPLTIGGDGFYQSQNGKDSAIKRDGSPISLQNNISALGIGGGGGGNIENLGAGAHTSGRPGGSGGGSAGPWRSSMKHEKYTGGASLQGNTLDDDPTSVTNLVPGGYPGNSLINDPLGTHDMKPVMGMGGGGASGVIHADDNASMGWMHLNGQDGVQIKVGGNPRVVAAGGGGSQMGYHPSWHGPGTRETGMYNTNMRRGLGGTGGGGDGMLWRTRWAQAIAGKDYPAHYMRLAQSGEDNTGSGGGGASPGEAGSLEAYYTSGSGGSGLVVIELPRTKVVEDISDEQNDGPVTFTTHPKLFDSNGDEIREYTDYNENGETYRAYKFEATGEQLVRFDHPTVADLLLVGGGGGGESSVCGDGAGGGGVGLAKNVQFDKSQVSIFVGSGGNPGQLPLPDGRSIWQNPGQRGQDSYVKLNDESIKVIGGGPGAWRSGSNTLNNGITIQDGGCGGGNRDTNASSYGGVGRALRYDPVTDSNVVFSGVYSYAETDYSMTFDEITVFGNPGGTGRTYPGAGGGGAGGAADGANGGAGFISTFAGGVPVMYGGGGGGGADPNNLRAGLGGVGGGGNGGQLSNGGDGEDGTGGGGGGGNRKDVAYNIFPGGNGGKGVVIVRFSLSRNQVQEIVESVGYPTISHSTTGEELPFTRYIEGGKTYRSYAFKETGVKNISIDHPIIADFIIAAGGGGGYSSTHGLFGGGGAGGVVTGTNFTLQTGDYKITVGNGGRAGPMTQEEHALYILGDNVIGIENAAGQDYTQLLEYGQAWQTQNSGLPGEDSSIEQTDSSLSIKAAGGAGSCGPYVVKAGGSTNGATKMSMSVNGKLPIGYMDDGITTFEFDNGQAYYSNDQEKYGNVIVYGNKGGYHPAAATFGWSGSGGGGAGGAGGTVTGTPDTNGNGNSGGGDGGLAIVSTIEDGNPHRIGAGGVGTAGSSSFGPNSGQVALGGAPLGIDAEPNTAAGGASQLMADMPGSGISSTSRGGSGIVCIRFAEELNRILPVEEEVENEADIVLPPHDAVYAIGPGDVRRHPSFRMFEKELNGTFTEKPFGSTLSLDKSYKFIRHPSILGKIHPFVFENSQYYNVTYTQHEVGIVDLEDKGVLVFTDKAKEGFNNGLFNKVEYTCMTHPARMSGFFRLEDEAAPPVATLRSPFLQSGQRINMDRVILEVIFNKTVHDLSLIDFSTTNCRLSNLRGGNRVGSGNQFRVDVEITDPSSSKTCIVQLKQDSVTDDNNNLNSISTPFVIEYEYVNKLISPSELFNIFKDDADIPPEEQMDESEINLVISQAFTIPDPSTPDFDETDDDSEETVSPTRNEKFINPPKLKIPAGIQIKNRKQFKKLMTQVFENVTTEVKSLKIDKTSLVVAQEAEAFISNVEEVVMVKSNQTEPIDVSTLIEDQTKPSATYVPLSEVGSFCVLDIDGVEYTLLAKEDDQCEITNGATGDATTWQSGSVVELTDTKRFIIGSATLSIDAVAEEDLIVETQSCFRKDTLITTDQETIKIQNIKPDYHTINGKQIKYITPVYNADGVLVRIEKDCLGENKPSNTVYMQKDHKLLISPAEIAALFNSGKITFERSSTREILYNVLLDSHETMIVENIKAETLNPELTISKYFLEGKPTELKEFIEENTRTIPIV